MPGALLIADLLSKHRDSSGTTKRLPQGLEEPLLAPTADQDAEEQLAQPPGSPYVLWRSQLFWLGSVLLLISAALLALTVATVLLSY